MSYIELSYEAKRGPSLVMHAIPLVVLVATMLPLGTGPRQVAAQPACHVLADKQICGRFLEEWSRPGSEQASVYVNGLPITARRQEISLEDGKSYETQWFERARYEAHPEKVKPYDVLLGRLGASLVEGRGQIDPGTGKVVNPDEQPFVGIDLPAGVNGRDRVWFPETRHSVSGKVLEYWSRYGGLKQFGFPLSEAFDEVSPTDGKTYTVQYFERNRFELHPEKAAPYEVELGLLGVQQHAMVPVPVDQLPVAPPKGVTSKRDTLILGSIKEPTNLFLDTIGGGSATVGLLDAAVVGLDDKQNWFPWAAWYVPTLDNGGAYYTGAGENRQLVVKYKIRPGIKYSDGIELTSNDFVFAYRYNPTNLRLADVYNPDRYTVIYRFMSYKQARDLYDRVEDKENYAVLKGSIDRKRPVADPSYSGVGTFLPEHVLKDVPNDKIADSSYAHEGFVGTGPYRIERWISGQELVLVQNDNYTLTARPLIKRVILRFIGDQAEIIRELQTGDIDAALSNAFPSPLDQVNTLGPNLVVRVTLSNIWEYVAFHYTYAPFKERAVREAIITAVNRQAIVDRIYSGRSPVLNTFVPETQWSSLQNPDFAKNYPDVAARWKLPVYNHDPDKANRILDAAGWTRGPDGVRTKGGDRLEFELATTAGAAARELSTGLIQADLDAVGIKANLKYYSPDEFFGWNGVITRGHCQMCEFALIQTPDANFELWQSSQIPTPENRDARNIMQYSNPRVEELAELFDAEVDRRAVAPYAAEIQVVLMQDIAAMPLFTRSGILVHREGLQNYIGDYLGDVWWRAAQWYFDR